MKEVEERDHLRNFQPVFTGQLIMEIFNLKPGPEVGKLKIALREAILEGKLKNTTEESREYMIEIARELGISSN